MAGGRIAGITVVLDGDATKLNAALKSVDTQIKTTQGQLKDINKLLKLDPGNTELLTQKQKYLGQALTESKTKLDVLRQATEQVGASSKNWDTYKSKVAPIEAEIEKAKVKAQSLKSEMDTLAKAGGVDSTQYNALQAELTATRQKAADLQTQVNKTWEDCGRPISTEAQDQLQRELEETKIKIKELEQQGATTSESLQKMNTWGDKWQAAGQKIEGVGRSLKPLSTIAGVVSAAGVKAAMDWETAFTGVKKTVDATDEEYAKLAEGIQKMATETASSMEEIAGVAEVAGQLGIAKESLLDFTRVMVELGDTTNLSAEEAATALARFINITGDSQDDVDRLGSSIVALGNNFATSESEIVQMATRLAAAGTIAGLSSTDILALSAAMSSVGIEAEAGGTAMTQTLNAIEMAIVKVETATEKDLESAKSRLQDFATVAGMSAEDFAEAWRTNPIEALTAFISGLGRLDEEGESTTATLVKLGLTGVRQSGMLKSLGLASDMLADSLETSATAFEENTALADEAALRYETSAAKMNQFKESVKMAGIELGEAMLPVLEKLMDALGKLFQWFSKLPDGVQSFIATILVLTAVLAPLLIVIGKLTTGIGALLKLPGKISTLTSSIGGLAAKITGVSSAASGAASAASTAAAAVEGVGTAATGAAASAGTAASGLAGLGANALWVAGPLGAIFAGFGIGIKQGIDDIKAFNAEMSVQYQTVSEAQAAIQSYTEQIAAQQTEIDNLANNGCTGLEEAYTRLAELKALLAEAEAQQAALLEAENNQTQNLTGQLDENTGAVQENSDALKEANSSLEETATGTKEAATEALTEMSETTAETCETMAEATEKTEETCNSIAESFNKLKETLTTTFEELKTLITTTWDEIKATISGGGEEGGGLGIAEKFTEMGTTIQTAIEGWSVNITAALETIKVSFTTAWTEIMTFLTTTWTTIQTTATTVWTAIQTFYTTFWLNMTTLTTTSMTTISTTMNESWTLIIEFVTVQLTALLEITTTTFNQITALITTGMAQIVATIKTAANQITATIRTLVNSAYGWGADFVGGFQAGILSRMYALLATVRNMAAQIASYLHFSEPDRGPLSNYHTWMPDFMKGLADDINRNKYLVEDAIQKVAGNMTIHPQLALAQVAGGYGGGAKNTMSHTGTIRVQGVNDREQVAAIVDIVIDQLRQEVRT